MNFQPRPWTPTARKSWAGGLGWPRYKDRSESLMGLHDFFEYNDRKAWINLKTHRVSFEEAMTVFTDPLSITIPDILHSDEEERRIIIGQSVKRRLLVVVHVELGEK
ncbi:MAG: BrnT family toxin [bacterium]